jgi:hypothetical protein
MKAQSVSVGVRGSETVEHDGVAPRAAIRSAGVRNRRDVVDHPNSTGALIRHIDPAGRIDIHGHGMETLAAEAGPPSPLVPPSQLFGTTV